MDMKTDDFIQRVIRDKFRETTVITIAHRLNTIADYNKILVLDRGSVAEEGSPYDLIQRRGIFAKMVQNTGKDAENIIKKASQSHQKNQ